MLGIDEAGRGSLLGPLVVGGFLVGPEYLDRLSALGVKDSKLLSPPQRETLYQKLRAFGRCAAVAIAPREIDRWVSRGQLNQLEARSFATLIRRYHPTEVYVDACDPEETRFARQVRRFAHTRSRIVARHHADRDIPVVSAASIVAKVRRDRAIERLRRQIGTEIGSGYPSDKSTIEYARSILRQGLTETPWVRHSWSTARRLKAERAARSLDEFVS